MQASGPDRDRLKRSDRTAARTAAPQAVALPRAERVRYAFAAWAPMVIAALVETLASLNNAEWYEGLVLPSFAVPAWVLGAASTLADLAVAWAFDRVLCGPDWMPDRPGSIRAFTVLALLTLAWPLAFFVARSPAAGLTVLLALLAAALRAGRRFGLVDRAAGRCVLVYGAWTGFLALLGLSIVIRN